jgi:hypothetical protein
MFNTRFDKFSSSIEVKIDDLISTFLNKTQKLLNDNLSLNEVSKIIYNNIVSEISLKSKTLLEDLYSYLTNQVLKTTEFSDINTQYNFYKINLRKEISQNFSFIVQSYKLNFIETRKFTFSSGIGVGSGILCYILITIFLPTNFLIPLFVSIGSSVAVYYILYSKIILYYDKKRFFIYLLNFLRKIKNDFLLWFDEVQIYFEKRVNDIIIL